MRTHDETEYDEAACNFAHSLSPAVAKELYEILGDCPPLGTGGLGLIYQELGSVLGRERTEEKYELHHQVEIFHGFGSDIDNLNVAVNRWLIDSVGNIEDVLGVQTTIGELFEDPVSGAVYRSGVVTIWYTMLVAIETELEE